MEVALVATLLTMARGALGKRLVVSCVVCLWLLGWKAISNLQLLLLFIVRVVANFGCMGRSLLRTWNLSLEVVVSWGRLAFSLLERLTTEAVMLEVVRTFFLSICGTKERRRLAGKSLLSAFAMVTRLFVCVASCSMVPFLLILLASVMPTTSLLVGRLESLFLVTSTLNRCVSSFTLWQTFLIRETGWLVRMNRAISVRRGALFTVFTLEMVCVSVPSLTSLGLALGRKRTFLIM